MLGALDGKFSEGVDKYNSLEKGSKTAINGVIVIGSVLALYMGYKLFTGMGTAIKSITGEKWNEERKAEESNERTILKADISKQAEKPTLTDSEAQNVANLLYQSFLNSQPEWSANLWDEGTDEKKLFATLNLLKNRADWLLVSLKYGMPRRRNLAAEFGYELNTSEMNKLREVLAKINVKI